MFADRVIYSNNVYTGNKYNAQALAIGIKDDEIIFVGNKDQARDIINDDTQIEDRSRPYNWFLRCMKVLK